MAKKKKFKLNRTTFFSPIIAVIGGRQPMDDIPIDYSELKPLDNSVEKVNTRGFGKNLNIKRGIFTKKK